MKISFKKITNHKVLVYDLLSLKYAKKLFHCKLEIYHTRYEEINFFILIKSILWLIKKNYKFSFENLKATYKEIFFNIVKPKIVYTAIDNNPGFFKLKSFYPSAVYVADQNGMRDNKFYNIALSHFSKTKKKLTCDYMYVFGKNNVDKLKNIIKTKFIIGGNTLNNAKIFSVKKKYKRSIAYLSGANSEYNFNLDKPILLYLSKFCEKHNFNMYIILRPARDKKNKYYNLLKKRKFNFIDISEHKNKNNYVYLNSFDLLVFHHTTLGYEALSRKIKCISFGHKHLPNHKKIYKNKGYFWDKLNNFSSFEKKLIYLLKINKDEWNKKIQKYLKDIMMFDTLNKSKYRLIYSILNKK